MSSPTWVAPPASKWRMQWPGVQVLTLEPGEDSTLDDYRRLIAEVSPDWAPRDAASGGVSADPESTLHGVEPVSAGNAPAQGH